MKFIRAQGERWGVEPICRTLQVAPSTYYAVVAHRPSARQLSDERLKIEIARVHRANFGVYGIEKVWRQLKREGHKVGRDRVARLMDDLELSGVVRGKKKRTTTPDEVSPRPADLVERNFAAEAPNRFVGLGPHVRQHLDRLCVRRLTEHLAGAGPRGPTAGHCRVAR